MNPNLNAALDKAVIAARHRAAQAQLVADRALAAKLNSDAVYSICFECHGDTLKKDDGTFTCLVCGVRFDERGERIDR